MKAILQKGLIEIAQSSIRAQAYFLGIISLYVGELLS